MPELPDIDAYIAALDERIVDEPLRAIRVLNPFLLRSVSPSPDDCVDRRVTGLRRIGKRIAIGLEADLWLVFHLMIAGRLQWRPAAAGPAKRSRNTLAMLDFASGSLVVTEAGSKKRASLYIVPDEKQLAAHDPGGLEVLDCSYADFSAALDRENRTLKRALTDPRLLSGIGNAYSDEILHIACLAPTTWTTRLSDDERRRLYDAVQGVLSEWRDRLIDAARQQFPTKVTAFRPQMRVHGKFGKPCPACGTEIQRIRYASNETNYCPRCQTGGKLLADRSLSRLLKGDWPRTIEDLESLPAKPTPR